MAKILTTKGCAAELEDLIRRSERQIYLISFSFIISDSFIVGIKRAAKKGVVVNIVYGKSIDEGSLTQLKTVANLNIYFYQNLHAKIFANETKCIVGSMNFSEVSEIRNTELGVLLNLEDDKEAFVDAIDHCEEILNDAKKKYPRNSQATKASYVAPAKKDVVPKTRSEFVFKVLSNNYGPVKTEVNEAGSYYKLLAYDTKIYLNDERIDFIYDNNDLYYNKKKKIRDLLTRITSDKFWVNSSRVNVTAKTFDDLENVIREIMKFTFIHLLKRIS